MIIFSVRTDNETLQKIMVLGHANSNVVGKDIVCAGVSVACMMTINQIILFGLKDDVKYLVKEGEFLLEVLNVSETLNKIIENLVFTLRDLKERYRKYIKEELC